ncbi:hypothetical protein MTP99_014240 [Tenebrio molitor]|nr:hypothetical protein MTP99_014240 [Tenebrio molitor]
MSHVWKHFTKTIDKNKSNTVKCNYCGNQYSRGGNNSRNFNTSNLTKHLKRCSKYNTETSAAIKKTLNSAQTSQSQTLHSKFDAHNAELEEVNPHDADDAQMEDGPTTNLFVPEESLKTIMKDYLTEDDADSDVTAATKEISSQISKRFGEIKNNETYILATALDPRYKAQLFSDETKDELKDLLKENYPLRYANDHERSPQQYQEFDTLDKTEEAGTITLFSVTKKLLLSKNKSDEHSTGTTSKNKNIDRDIENEISVYLHERTEPLESDPVEFWKKEIRFPHLKKLAAYYLAIPAGSVFSEQIFSETGCIVTSKRTSLTAEHVKQLIFLKKNWMILEK